MEMHEYLDLLTGQIRNCLLYTSTPARSATAPRPRRKLTLKMIPTKVKTAHRMGETVPTGKGEQARQSALKGRTRRMGSAGPRGCCSHGL